MLIHDPAIRKLGRSRRSPKDPRHLRFAKYLASVLPPIPASADWTLKVAPPIGMMKNDQYGDCTCAAVGHAIQVFTANNGAEISVSDDAVLQLYAAVTGAEGAAFDPATGANDNGAMIDDVLNEWRKNGIGGHKLGAFVSVDPANLDHIRLAIDLFGAVDIGLQLPVSCQTQEVWDVTDPNLQGDAAPGSWGGHSVILPKFVTIDGLVLTCATWGMWQPMTEAFFRAYCDEADALLSADWVSGTKPAPSGFDMSALQADLAAL